MWNDRYINPCGLIGRANFDPGTLMAASMVGTAASGGLSAASTLAGGSWAKQAGILQKDAADKQAIGLEQNASQAFAAGQRKSLETRMRTNLATSTATARAGASGVNAGEGSAATAVGKLEQRGSYMALMDMFNGESEATGLRNQAAAVRFGGDVAKLEGEQKKRAATLSALGTLAGTAGSMAKSYSAFKFPTTRGAASVNL